MPDIEAAIVQKYGAWNNCFLTPLYRWANMSYLKRKKRINQFEDLTAYKHHYTIQHIPGKKCHPSVSIIVEERHACLKDLQALENFHSPW